MMIEGGLFLLLASFVPGLAYHAIVIFSLLMVLATLVGNLCVFKSLRPTAAPKSSDDHVPMVSVLIPARNEARRIGPCIESLLAQDYANYEVLVLDDQSEDGTAELLRRSGFNENGDESSPARLLRGEPLPEGWTGKCWACQQLAQAAHGEWLFFTDADTVHSPETIRVAQAHAQQTHADLLSAWPRLITETLGEKLVIPIIHIFAVGLYPHAILDFLQRHPEHARTLSRGALRTLGGANGQFLFLKKSAYETIGGHAAVRDHLVEDVALGREVALRLPDGMRLVNCDASHLVRCRMYSSFPEVWEGFTKNIRAAFEDALGMWCLAGVLQTCCFFLPFVLVFFPAQRRFAAVEIALVYLIRVILTVRLRTSWLGCVLHPIGHFLAMCIALNSWRRTDRAGVTWKGRTYRAGRA